MSTDVIKTFISLDLFTLRCNQHVVCQPLCLRALWDAFRALLPFHFGWCIDQSDGFTGTYKNNFLNELTNENTIISRITNAKSLPNQHIWELTCANNPWFDPQLHRDLPRQSRINTHCNTNYMGSALRYQHILVLSELTWAMLSANQRDDYTSISLSTI